MLKYRGHLDLFSLFLKTNENNECEIWRLIKMTEVCKYKDKEWLYHEYVVLKKSLRKVGRECGISGDTIKYWLQKHGISRRTISESLMGKNNPMYGKTFNHTEEAKTKISISKIGKNNPNSVITSGVSSARPRPARRLNSSSSGT